MPNLYLTTTFIKTSAGSYEDFYFKMLTQHVCGVEIFAWRITALFLLHVSTASELYIILECMFDMPGKCVKENGFVVCYVLAEIFQVYTVHKLRHRAQVACSKL